MGLESVNALSGSARLRVSTFLSAALALGLGYAMAVSVNPGAPIPLASAHAMTIGANADTIDNSRECDVEAGVTTACVFP